MRGPACLQGGAAGHTGVDADGLRERCAPRDLPCPSVRRPGVSPLRSSSSKHPDVPGTPCRPRDPALPPAGLQQLCRLLLEKFDVYGKTPSQERMIAVAQEARGRAPPLVIRRNRRMRSTFLPHLWVYHHHSSPGSPTTLSLFLSLPQMVNLLSHSAVVDPQHLMDRGYDPSAPPSTSAAARHNARARSPLGSSRARSPTAGAARARSPQAGFRGAHAAALKPLAVGVPARAPLDPGAASPAVADAAAERMQRLQQHAPGTRPRETGPANARLAAVPPPAASSDRVFSLMALAGNRTFRLGKFDPTASSSGEFKPEGAAAEMEASIAEGDEAGAVPARSDSLAVGPVRGGSLRGSDTGAVMRASDTGGLKRASSQDADGEGGGATTPGASPTGRAMGAAAAGEPGGNGTGTGNGNGAHALRATAARSVSPPLHLNRHKAADRTSPEHAGEPPKAASLSQLGATAAPRRTGGTGAPRAPPLTIPGNAPGAEARSPTHQGGDGALSPAGGATPSPSPRLALSPSVLTEPPPSARSPQPLSPSPLSPHADPPGGGSTSPVPGSAAASPTGAAPAAAGAAPPSSAAGASRKPAVPGAPGGGTLKPIGAGIMPASNGGAGFRSAGHEKFAMRLPPVSGIRGTPAVGSLRGIALPGGSVSMVPASAVRPVAPLRGAAGASHLVLGSSAGKGSGAAGGGGPAAGGGSSSAAPAGAAPVPTARK